MGSPESTTVLLGAVSLRLDTLGLNGATSDAITIGTVFSMVSSNRFCLFF